MFLSILYSSENKLYEKLSKKFSQFTQIVFNRNDFILNSDEIVLMRSGYIHIAMNTKYVDEEVLDYFVEFNNEVGNYKDVLLKYIPDLDGEINFYLNKKPENEICKIYDDGKSVGIMLNGIHLQIRSKHESMIQKIVGEIKGCCKLKKLTKLK